MKKLLYILAPALLLLGAALTGHAQNKVSGTVTDPEGNPLIQASVIVEGTTQGTVTDLDGKWTLSVKPGQTILVSYIGYTDERVKTTAARAVYDVTLSTDENFLDDVVVVGYGTTKKVNLTGSVSSVGSETIENKFLTNSSNALQGVAAGVTVTTQSGAPGDDGGTIRIRGLGTFGTSSAAPLVLIDGVQGTMNSVDASQIDKISVLKDAASSAIYGSRAANGVILITTKRGKAGKTTVTYRGNTGFQTPTDIPQVVNAEEYMMLVNETQVNDGAAPVYSEDYIANYRANHLIDPDTYPITDWQQTVLGKALGFSTKHTVSVATSTDKVKVLSSFAYLHQTGLVKNMREYDRFNFRNNMDLSLSGKVTMKLDMNVIYSDKNHHPNESTLFNYMNTRDPLILSKFSTGYNNAFSGTSTNILAYLEGQGGWYRDQGLTLVGSAALNYTPTEWLSIDAQYAPRFTLSNNHRFLDQVTLYIDPYGTESSYHGRPYNELTESYSNNFYNTVNLTATLHKNFDRVHDVKLLVGYSWEDMFQNSLSANRRNFAYPQYDVISAGADDETKDNGGAMYEWALQSFFGRLNYNFKERYLLEANVRIDGSSRFTGSKQYGIFPSFSAAWRVTEEPFMQSLKKTVNELKLRGSYGTLGNQSIGSDYYPTVQTLAVGSISANDNIYPIVTLNTLANPVITWETSKMLDFGIDAGLFGKLDITADWYYKTTEGILLELDIPLAIGLNAPYQNAGTVLNSGWEIAVSWNDKIGNVRYGIDANLSDVQNTITDLRGMRQQRNSDMIINIGGYPINSIYGYICEGMARDQEQADYVNGQTQQLITIKPGDLVYKDIAGKKVYDEDGNPVYDKYGYQLEEPDGKITADDKTIIGNTIPRYTYGVTLNLGWKNWDLSAFFQGVGKVDGLLNTYYVMPNTQGGTFRRDHLDRWTVDNPDGYYPRMSGVTANTNQISSFWVRSAAYCRLKNLQLTYTLPKKLVSQVGLSKAKCFVNAQNLFTWTNFYQGYDPEVCYTGTDGVTLGSASNYPQVKTITAGVEITF